MIDARGRSCPEPVIMLKKALKTNAASYDMMVDNQVSVENITRFAKNHGYQVDSSKQGADFVLKITKA